ncbi:microcephalin-like isoform X2 [Oscarella lobularis]|uniref:microcephalin-like isoform X2 n=1 Tax=Oscarella lobularis TaxID=121494 RepID=UPI0033140458
MNRAENIHAEDRENTEIGAATNASKEDGVEADQPSTQRISQPLEGVVACVEVRDFMENRFSGVAKQVEKLGGKAVNRIRKDVTHLIFQDGKPHVLEKAEMKKIHIVSVMWLENCRLSGERVSEAKYPAFTDGTSSVLWRKHKRMKLMQPKQFDEETIKLSVERSRKRREKREILFGSGKATTPKASRILALDTQPASLTPLVVRSNDSSGEMLTVGESPSSSSERKMSSYFWGFTYDDLEEDKKMRQALFPDLDPADIDLTKLECELGISPSSSKKTPLASSSRENEKETKKSGTPMRSQKRKLLNRKNLTFPNEKTPEKKSKSPPISNDFTPTSKRTRKQSIKKSKQSLVMTSLSPEDRDVILSLVSALGTFCVENDVSDSTTHVVCGEGRRTLSVLRGIARGTWILSYDWILKSLEEHRWVDEDKYEMNAKFPGAKISRMKKRNDDPGVLCEVSSIFVAKSTVPEHPVLMELVELCNGELVGTARGKETVCVGGGKGMVVTEKWLLDTIAHQTVMPLDLYTQ